MKRNLILSVASVATVMVATSCSKLQPLTAENFNVTPTPLVLEGNSVEATINTSIPEKYMRKKAVITVTPELRGTNGTVVRGQGVTFQGEKVNGNDQTISYALGGRYAMRENFPYNDDVHASDLYLTFDAKVGKKAVVFPDVKVGYGVLATSGLYKQAVQQGGGIYAQDAYQQIVKQRHEANIKFLINQAQLRKSELKNNSVQEFVDLLARINADAEGYNLNDIEVLAYASPDGGEKFNDKLADKRQKISEKYVGDQLKKAGMDANVTGEYTAQDWEGFQELVAASDIQDKELILRVLSMYKDPQEREDQIRNLSKGFQDLASQILPQLRRSRMIINYETVGRSDDQIIAQYKEDASKLSVEELLYCAHLANTAAAKEEIYKTCAELYPNDYRAFNNVASSEIAKGNLDAAKQYVQKALGIDARNAESQANLALVALQQGDIKQAEAYMAKAGNNCPNINEVQGAVEFAKGNYAKAADLLKGVNSNMAALAQIQSQQYKEAAATLKAITDRDGMTEYLGAILAARQGNAAAAQSYLKDAIQKNPGLAKYAGEDLEFQTVK